MIVRERHVDRAIIARVNDLLGAGEERYGAAIGQVVPEDHALVAGEDRGGRDPVVRVDMQRQIEIGGDSDLIDRLNLAIDAVSNDTGRGQRQLTPVIIAERHIKAAIALGRDVVDRTGGVESPAELPGTLNQKAIRSYGLKIGPVVARCPASIDNGYGPVWAAALAGCRPSNATTSKAQTARSRATVFMLILFL